MSIYQTARRINSDINARVAYVPDQVQFGVPELWKAAITQGDCEDYALAKYDALVAAGVDATRLRLACVFVEDGGYHAVLVVTDDDGNDWVLDNRFPDVFESFGKVGYRLDKIWSHTLNAWEGA
jgi:predicted transglutaminase-like cysteine proteinase